MTITAAATRPTDSSKTSTSLALVKSSTRSGKVMVFIRLVFNVNTLVPTQKDILAAVDKKLRTQFRIVTQTTFQNATYIKLARTSYAIDLAFEITNVTIEETLNQSNTLTFTSKTYNQIQDLQNSLLRNIVCLPDNKQFSIPNGIFTVDGIQIIADMTYVYNEADTNLPSAFIQEILKVSGLLPTTAAPTTTTSTTLLPSLLLSTFYSTTSGGGFPGWALAIIIPCGIAIILIPLWILLACLLCGCCAGIRRRWHRRRSYNVEHTTTYGLF
ncbi:hypothetical protein DPEC_G00370800 [Dallia pectoralis]|nr:hypothetical protein DPEC_G00370800 [Dallia pectoralis]